ncbi:hypothetical protein BGX21_008430 [Mortierella sp. AD011]|nr:hypothetical protein BGX20_008530 [Mortierella sp. AD010]KAF9397840.1 hypothetical protein BGX21_008430 [Mortierella sp. AD011]
MATTEETPSALMPASLPSSASSSPALSSTGRFKPQPINLVYNSHLELPQSSPKRGSIAAHLMSFAAKSTTSLHILSSSAPTHSSSSTSPSSQDGAESQVPAHRTAGFSNPFKKFQNTFSSSKKDSDSASIKPEKVASSSSSVNSMTSWRSKGAEMFSKKNWGRARKNSEPTFSASKGLAASPIFGAGLEDAVRMSHIPGTPMVPAVLFRCAEYLEAKGIDEVGLYRVPGSHASVQKLKKMFDSGKDIKLLTMDAIDPNDIATLLKLYLRELPTPLLPAVFLEQFQSVISTDRQVCHSLRGILLRLPRTNYVVLSFLCHHLSRIAGYSEKTKMNTSNLAVVFAPTLSIGSVLFKALLGDYYDSDDTTESRDKGLKIVWGGLLQDFDYGVQEDWDDDDDSTGVQLTQSQSTPHLPLTPAQEFVNATQTAQSAPTEPQIRDSVAADEAKLMAAMLLKEELAAKEAEDDETASNVSESCGSIPCTDATVVSSPGMDTKDALDSSSALPPMGLSPTLTSTATITAAEHDLLPSSTLSSPSALAIPLSAQTPSSTSASTDASAHPEPPTINITIDAGSLFSPLAAEFAPEALDAPLMKTTEASNDNATHVSDSPPMSTPQPPSLEGLMIAL